MNGRQAKRLREEAKVSSGGQGFRAIRLIEKKLKQDFQIARKAPPYKRVKDAKKPVSNLKSRERHTIIRISRNFQRHENRASTI